MRKKTHATLPLTLIQLAMNSGETIARRWWLAASGKLSSAESRRMVMEKVKATQQMGTAMLFKPNIAKLLNPLHVGARRNVKRLRKRKS